MSQCEPQRQGGEITRRVVFVNRYGVMGKMEGWQGKVEARRKQGEEDSRRVVRGGDGAVQMVKSGEEKNGERKLEEQERRNLEHSARAPTPRRGDSRLGVQSSSPGLSHPCLGMDTTPRHPKFSSGPSHPRLGVNSNA
ncbi:hypothetical protein PIB30_077340 [Stylosanthes scabra]|uniref:Uncharacterized protein n=1 Tax=Stylosanthes scabra TaxID=79078 RepID=A0ABU6ZPA5_9FABA|nr:hypothetical protein [Stylosanthes scabra]